MPTMVVIGAGATGIATARLLADSGHSVRLVSRRGTGPTHPRIETIRLNAAGADLLTDVTIGAEVLFNCAMPAYDRWAQEFPALAAAVLAVAQRTGSRYVLLGNTYGYGPVDGPMTENLPMVPTTIKGEIRAQIWHDALAAHEQGRVQIAEVRASEYLGKHAASGYTLIVAPAVLGSAEVAYAGDLDVPKSWTYTGDVARTLVAASQRHAPWGRAWHVPSVSTLSARTLSQQLATLAGVTPPTFREVTIRELARMGRDDPILAELVEMQYIDRRPHILDSTDTESTLGVRPSPIDDVLREMIHTQRSQR